MTDHHPLFLPNLLTLRYSVLALGEERRWWPSALLSADSFTFMEYVAPRTAVAAAIHAATEVGRAVHDRLIGAGKFHLFRLPQALEEKAFHYLQNGKTAAELANSIGGQALARLEELSRFIAVGEQPGPVQVGGAADLHDEQILAVFAGHYREAFVNNYQTFPYLA